MNENVEDLTELSLQQEKAIELLLIGVRMDEIANQLKVNVNTVYRWRAIPLFQYTLKCKQDELIESSFNRIKNLSNNSLNVLEELLSKSDNSNIKMKSAMYILDKLFILYQEDVIDKLNELENIIKRKD